MQLKDEPLLRLIALHHIKPIHNRPYQQLHKNERVQKTFIDHPAA